MPPSADDLPGRTSPPPPQRQQPRGEGKKRPGKQPGAPGADLAWSESPQRTVPVFPQGACGCGRGLAAAADLGVAASH
jgi:transposase